VTSEDVTDGRAIRLAGLPDFNATDASFRITSFEGIFTAPAPDAQFAAAGAGAGAVPSGGWLPKERPLVLAGYIYSSSLALLPGLARSLLAALPTTVESTVQILANGRDTLDLQVFVRRYDAAPMPISSRLDFTIPLLAADPYLYGLTPLAGGMGVFAGSIWYQPYSKPSGTWVRQYVKAGSVWTLQYAKQVASGPYGESLTLSPPLGGATSRRLTFTVYGPLTAGDWQIIQVGTDRKMWVQLSLAGGQSLTIDCNSETVTMAGQDVTSYLYGDMLTLEPGGSTYQLTSATQNLTAYATVSALPAYEI
jgi:hypothetical protein